MANPRLEPGDQGEHVTLLKTLLRELLPFPMDAGIPQTDDYDSATVAAVEYFQMQRSLRVDGVVGRFTWRALLGEADEAMEESFESSRQFEPEKVDEPRGPIIGISDSARSQIVEVARGRLNAQRLDAESAVDEFDEWAEQHVKTVDDRTYDLGDFFEGLFQEVVQSLVGTFAEAVPSSFPSAEHVKKVLETVGDFAWSEAMRDAPATYEAAREQLDRARSAFVRSARAAIRARFNDARVAVEQDVYEFFGDAYVGTFETPEEQAWVCDRLGIYEPDYYSCFDSIATPLQWQFAGEVARVRSYVDNGVDTLEAELERHQQWAEVLETGGDRDEFVGLPPRGTLAEVDAQVEKLEDQLYDAEVDAERAENRAHRRVEYGDEEKLESDPN